MNAELNGEYNDRRDQIGKNTTTIAVKTSLNNSLFTCTFFFYIRKKHTEVWMMTGCLFWGEIFIA